MVVHITGKWFQYGILFIVLLLDLNMWKNQIFYEPILYGQFIGPEGRIYTVFDAYSLENAGNTSIFSFAWRNSTINPLTNETYILQDYRTNSRFRGYSLKIKGLAFIPSLITFVVFGLLIHQFGKKPVISHGTAVFNSTTDTIDSNIGVVHNPNKHGGSSGDYTTNTGSAEYTTDATNSNFTGNNESVGSMSIGNTNSDGNFRRLSNTSGSGSGGRRISNANVASRKQSNNDSSGGTLSSAGSGGRKQSSSGSGGGILSNGSSDRRRSTTSASGQAVDSSGNSLGNSGANVGNSGANIGNSGTNYLGNIGTNEVAGGTRGVRPEQPPQLDEQLTEVEGEEAEPSQGPGGGGRRRGLSPSKKSELERDLLLCELRVENCDLRVNNLSNELAMA